MHREIVHGVHVDSQLLNLFVLIVSDALRRISQSRHHRLPIKATLLHAIHAFRGPPSWNTPEGPTEVLPETELLFLLLHKGILFEWATFLRGVSVVIQR
jgi:hypothetical protein